MTPDLAQSLARSLMDAHHLREWSFAFNRRKRSLGVCYYERKRIELSVYYIARNEEPSIRDTILHEIAHALAGRRAGHGAAWKAICRALGATPQRCDSQAAMPAGRWHATCPSCQRVYTRHRRPQRHATYACRKCGRERGPIVFMLRLACNQGGAASAPA